MDWNRGFSAKYVLANVNPETWHDTSETEFMSGSIDRDSTSSLVESAEVKVDEDPGEHWIRIYLMAHQTGGAAKVALFTGLTGSPERSLDGNRVTYSVDCYSVLKPADDVLVARGYYAPGGSGARLVRELLSVSPAPVVIVGQSPGITSSIVAEDGETRLSMANKILDSIGWVIRISGDGTVAIMAETPESTRTFGKDENDVLETNITDSYDWYSCPNAFRAVSEEYGIGIARDDSPKSVLSTVSRGREVWMEETGVTPSGSESMAEYALRRLREEQEPARTVKYTRRFFPDILPHDIVTLNYARQDLVGMFRVKSQSIELGYGCRTTEEAVKIE